MTQSTTCGYPPDLMDALRRVRPTPDQLEDEIRRDTDPTYVELSLRYALFAYEDAKAMRGRRLLDFGCGAGSSTVVLGRLAPELAVVGVDLELGNLEAARLRAAHHGVKAEFHLSPSPDSLPDVGMFDYVLLSAVYEHLLPAERGPLLRQLWAKLRPGGIMFVNQTPHRWYPVEYHTSGVPFLNYLPARVARWAATRFSPRLSRENRWEELLRWGIRGGTPGEVMRWLPGGAELLRPSRLGVRDAADLWYAVSMEARPRPVKRYLRWAFRLLRIVPSLSIAIRKGDTP